MKNEKREIKFRGLSENKRILTGEWEWVYFDLHQLALNTDLQGKFNFLRTDTITQFTGLHDKNGKEIYEGDILHFTSESINGYQKVIVEENLEVRFQDGAFTTILELLGNGLRRRDMFIIGNIYENEDLLKNV